ncbi:hypothetical protein HHI36_008432 [Cryptolaemus montrouzieri]|uniref:Uncharacterized protein n=1 Tax=Cryptolaemus montrouzieri TaxID=559131 RepID=A0ABD2MSY7_9CUCU
MIFYSTSDVLPTSLVGPIIKELALEELASSVIIPDHFSIMPCDMTLFIFALLNIGFNVANRDCARYFKPNNYIQNLPSLSLGYISELPIPSMKLPTIKPSKVMKTKVIDVVTKFVYRNPVCVKMSGKKTLCEKVNSKTNLEYTVTKEYFVENQDKNNREDFKSSPTIVEESRFEPFDENELGYIESSEHSRQFVEQMKTPVLSKSDINELLIEDRLDQLETILPYYTRKRVYETSTITITKVRNDNRVTATLLAKNCIPHGYPLCPPKIKKRKSKVAHWINETRDAKVKK